MKKSYINTKKERKKRTCSRILTPKQVGPICWFMATFVAMFYSQSSRKLLLEASKNWDKTKPLFQILHYILNDKYVKSGNQDYEYFFTDFVYFIILLLLNKQNNNVFQYDPHIDGNKGFIPEFYIGKLYKLLNIDYKMYDYNMSDNVLAYSYSNEDLNNFIKYQAFYQNNQLEFKISVHPNYHMIRYVETKYPSPPPILILYVYENNDKEFTSIYKNLLYNNIINDGETKESLKSMNKRITYLDVEYNLDAVILTNWNINKDNGHAIAGITCKKDRYVYNGWTRTSMDPVMGENITRNIPCELMKYDWNIQNNGDFCLNTEKCIPDVLKHKLKHHDICFNFSKGKRILIYVRIDTVSPESSESHNNHSSQLSSRLPSSKLTASQLSSRNTTQYKSPKND